MLKRRGECRWKHVASFAAAMTKGRDGRERRKKNQKRNADRRKALLPCRAGTAAPRSLLLPRVRGRIKEGAHICRRSTAALARGTLVPKAQRQARLPGTRQERLVLNARSNRGAKTLRIFSGRYPRSPVPVQRSTSRFSRIAEGLMPAPAP